MGLSGSLSKTVRERTSASIRSFNRLIFKVALRHHPGPIHAGKNSNAFFTLRKDKGEIAEGIFFHHAPSLRFHPARLRYILRAWPNHTSMSAMSPTSPASI